MAAVPIVSVVGKSNVGKTTLLEKLIPELKRRGYRVATLKHDAHSFEMDQPGKDTWRHRQAGADVVVISSKDKLAMIKRVAQEVPLEQIAAMVTDVDILLTEGYKRGPALKIEVSRRALSSELLCTAEELVAIASDQPFAMPVPQFGLDDVAGLADVLEKRFLKKVSS
jgi:molybdopterin-guanine dinucleotide biosynthesis adapter protein